METTISTYEQQAIDFLAKHEITFEAKFLRHGSMRWDTKGETRDIYTLVLRRGRRNISVEFGQSIAHSGEWIVKDKNPKFTKTFHDKGHANSYASRIGNSFNVSKNPNKEVPNAYSLLSVITKSDPGTFDEFCNEFGYDNDSISAKETWQAVREEWNDVRALFTDSELEELQEIQ